MTEIIVTQMRRDEHGYYTARVNLNGHSLEVSRRFGSWLAFGAEQRAVPAARRIAFEGVRDLPHLVTAALQKRLPAAERKAKR